MDTVLCFVFCFLACKTLVAQILICFGNLLLNNFNVQIIYRKTQANSLLLRGFFCVHGIWRQMLCFPKPSSCLYTLISISVNLYCSFSLEAAASVCNIGNNSKIIIQTKLLFFSRCLRQRLNKLRPNNLSLLAVIWCLWKIYFFRNNSFNENQRTAARTFFFFFSDVSWKSGPIYSGNRLSQERCRRGIVEDKIFITLSPSSKMLYE